jgi:nucleoside-diphosphate-sugar epimerase
MKKLLITGGSGFIGRHCLPGLLEYGYDVHVLSRNQRQGMDKNITWHCQDFLNNQQTKSLVEKLKPNYCMHLAWTTEPGKYLNSPDNLQWVSSSLVLLNSFYENGGERFVGAGTCFEYDGQFGNCSEAISPLDSDSLYGTSKNAFQKILASFSSKVSLSSSWGRVFFLYGPHEYPSRLVPSVITSLIRNEPALCSHGNQIRDFMHVEDVANAMVSLLESNVTGPVNIASGKPVFIKDIVNKIAELLNKSDNLKLGALPARKEPAVLIADISRLKNEVGFTPKFELENGLQQTINWWKETINRQD